MEDIILQIFLMDMGMTMTPHPQKSLMNIAIYVIKVWIAVIIIICVLTVMMEVLVEKLNYLIKLFLFIYI